MTLSPKERFYKKYFSAKDIFYPIRPLVTLAIGLALFSLGISGILGAGFLIWLGVTISSDDITMYPWLRVNKLYTNLTHRHKTLKASIGLVVISLALAGGLALGIFVCATNPVFLGWLIAIKASMDSSITILIACQVIGGLIAKYFGKPAILGIVLGSMIASIIPVTIPIAIEAVVLTTTMCTFFSAILIKQCMRLFTWIAYGHTNADGYHYAHETDKILDKDEQQAQVYNVTPENIRSLRKALIDSVKYIKTLSHVGNDISGSTGQMTAAYKDMLQLLNTAKTEEEAKLLREMIKVYNPYTKAFSKSYDTIGLIFSFKNSHHRQVYRENYNKNVMFGARSNTKDDEYENRNKYFSFWNKQGFESSIAKFNDADNSEIRSAAGKLGEAFQPFCHAA